MNNRKIIWSFDLFPSSNFVYTFGNINSKDFSILERGEEMPYTFYLTSAHFDSIDDTKKVYLIASFIIRLLNGYSYFVFDNKKEVSEFYLGDLYDKYNKKIYKESYSSPINYMEVDQYLTNQFPIEGNETSQLINLGLKPGLIRNLLLISGDGMTYSNMYKILDEIKLFLKGNEKIENIINAKELNRFTHTANNFETIGLDSRHGSTKNEKPKNPMGLTESQSLITLLVRLVIKKYFSISLPVIEDKTESFSVDDLFE